ncbi:MAG: metallophosphoesterase family protein [Thermoplasmatota archaeon]
MRFATLSDIHLIDDDAWYTRVEYLDPLSTPIAGHPNPIPFQAAQRPQDEYTDEVFASMVASINTANRASPISFVLATGDSVDNNLENELTRVMDIFDGTVSTSTLIHHEPLAPDAQGSDPLHHENWNPANTGAALQVSGLPASLRAPGANPGLDANVKWYLALGNHDHFIQGNSPAFPQFQAIAEATGHHFLSEKEFITTLAGGDPCANGGPNPLVNDAHGFAYAGARLCDGDVQNDGYYAFDSGAFRLVVLDTANDALLATNQYWPAPDPLAVATQGGLVGGYAEGALDVAQFQWLKAELAAHDDRPTLIFAHHDPANGYWLPNGSSALGFVDAKEVVDEIGHHDNVVAFVGGHTHVNLIQAVQPTGGRGFWAIDTASLIDLPQEGRLLDISYLGNGVVAIHTSMLEHSFQLSKDLAATDPQDNIIARSGGPGDRDALLYVQLGPAAAATLDAATGI